MPPLYVFAPISGQTDTHIDRQRVLFNRFYLYGYNFIFLFILVLLVIVVGFDIVGR